MRVFPESAPVQLEFEKIKNILAERSKSEYAKAKSTDLRVHTVKELIDLELKQTHEYKQLLVNGLYFPNDVVLNLARELKLLGIPGAVLSSEQFVMIRKLAQSMQSLFRWFDEERRTVYTALVKVISGTYYEKAILDLLAGVLDENGTVLDHASEDLRNIRLSLYRKRNELRRAFDRIVQRLNKQGYLADIEEAFLNGRRVLAVFAEQKRMVKGILLGESDTRRTSFIEPEETIELNRRCVRARARGKPRGIPHPARAYFPLSVYAPLLIAYHEAIGEYDFIEAKARLGIDMDGEYPLINDRSHVHLVNACHPLLLLYNKKQNKPVIPVSVTLDDKNRILVISGPNAGGKR